MAKQKTDNDALTAYYENIYATLDEKTQQDDYGSYLYKRVKGGQKTVYNKTQAEIRNFDMSFLDVIESVYPAILKIMRNPKKTIRYDEEVVAVEKAKKVNSQTVRHLSSHTQLIKEITKEGDVIPSKVLTTYAEEELAIYENRFIKSLVRRCEMFLERRYEVMKVSLESFATDRLNVQNEFLMSGQKVTVNLDISIKSDLTTNIEATKAQYERLLNVREMIQGLKGTEFMRALAKAREVLPPIMKTNIILHNPDFKLCYGLWLYLDRVDGISNDVEIQEKSYKFGQKFEHDINEVMALALTTFIKNRDIEGIYYSKNLQTVKAPKPEQNENIELEMNFSADNKKLEDYTMNQILLEKTAEFFEASMEGMKQTGNVFNESVRVVYRQMLEMLDQIYPKAFGISDDELESKDLYEQLEYARRQKMVVNIVKQQKQMNILRMGKEEKRCDKLIEKITKKIASAEEQERLRQEELARKAAEEARKAEEARLAEEARKKALQDEAIEKQKVMDKKVQEEKDKQEIAKQSGTHTSVRARELARGRRERLKELKAGVPENQDEVVYVDEEGNQIENPNTDVVDNQPQVEAQAEQTAPVEEAKVEETQPEEAPQTEEVQEAQPESREEAAPQEDTATEAQAEPVAEETPSEEAQEEAPQEEVQPESADAPHEQTEEEIDDEFAQFLESIPEGEATEDAPVEYVDEDGNPVDENGNPLSDASDATSESTEENTNNDSNQEENAADDYEKMLKDSGMTDEEIKALIGEK